MLCFVSVCLGSLNFNRCCSPDHSYSESLRPFLLPSFFLSLSPCPSPLFNVSDGRTTGDGSVFRNMAQGLAAPLQNPFSTDKNLISISVVFAHMWVHMVVFVCPNEPPCVYLCTTVRHKIMCIHFVCMCMYAHTFSAISFLLNDSMLTRSDKRDWK